MASRMRVTSLMVSGSWDGVVQVAPHYDREDDGAFNRPGRSSRAALFTPLLPETQGTGLLLWHDRAVILHHTRPLSLVDRDGRGSWAEGVLTTPRRPSAFCLLTW